MEGVRSAFKIITGKPTRNRNLGWPRRRWEDNTRMDPKEMKISTRNWINCNFTRYKL